jgi:hypothetical protein
MLSEKSYESSSGVDGLLLKILPALTKEGRTRFHQCIKSALPTLDSKTEMKIPADDLADAVPATYIQIYPKGAKSIASAPKPTTVSSASASASGDEPNIFDDHGNGGGSRSSSGGGSSDRGKRKGKGSGGKKKVVVQRWDKKRPNYTHFTVIKRMLATPEMIDKLARTTGVLPDRFAYCGSKDSRAVTLQRVSGWRLEDSMLERVNTAAAAADSKGISLRDIRPADEPLRLGDLSGNFFAITLRNDADNGRTRGSTDTRETSQNSLQTTNDLDAVDLLHGFAKIASKPFVNVFGAQRFGSPLATNPIVGQRLLASDYRGAVLLILMTPTGGLEKALGKLTLERLTSWLTEGYEVSKGPGNGSMNSDSAAAFFRHIQGKWSEYEKEAKQAIHEYMNRDEDILVVVESEVKEEGDLISSGEDDTSSDGDSGGDRVSESGSDSGAVDFSADELDAFMDELYSGGK